MLLEFSELPGLHHEQEKVVVEQKDQYPRASFSSIPHLAGQDLCVES